jgi:glucose-6-phosphate dehydrogenase assembly protein OpcA
MEKSVAGRAIRAARLETIEADLMTLWQELTVEKPATRAMMSNLVVYRERPEDDIENVDDLMEGLPIVEVAGRHPSRVIVLAHARADSQDQSPLAAAVGVVVYGRSGATYAVEQIAVRSKCADPSLPSIVRSLVLGDLPTSVWWTDDLSRTPPLETLVTLGRQFVFDSRQWMDARAGIAAVSGLHRQVPSLDMADLNWRRLAPMRRALFHGTCQSEGRLLDDSALSVRIVHRPGEAMLAWLLAGWLTSCTGTLPRSALQVSQSHETGDEVLSVTVGQDHRPTLTATMDAHQVRVAYASAAPPLTMAVPSESYADAIAAELRALGRDDGFIAALLAVESLIASGE